jgi:acetyl esterase/lipase
MTQDTVPDQLEETRQFNAALEELLSTMPPVYTVPPEVTRRAREEGTGTFPAPVVLEQGVDRVVPGRSGDIPVRVFLPPEGSAVLGVYLHIHGGGWVLGSARGQDPLLWNMASEAGVAVVSVDYRLAPEHPFPAGPDDCEDVALWLLDGGAGEVGAAGLPLVIGGESAGGHLAALTLLRLRDRDPALVERFVGANLVYGVYDLSETPSQIAWGSRELVLSRPTMQWFYECFVPGTSVEERRSPSISPLYADLSGLPPAYFWVGSMDPLLDDTLFMAARWRAAGSPVAEVRVFPEGVHGFNAFPIGLAREAMGAAVAFVRECVSSPR